MMNHRFFTKTKLCKNQKPLALHCVALVLNRKLETETRQPPQPSLLGPVAAFTVVAGRANNPSEYFPYLQHPLTITHHPRRCKMKIAHTLKQKAQSRMTNCSVIFGVLRECVFV